MLLVEKISWKYKINRRAEETCAHSIRTSPKYESSPCNSERRSVICFAGQYFISFFMEFIGVTLVNVTV